MDAITKALAERADPALLVMALVIIGLFALFGMTAKMAFKWLRESSAAEAAAFDKVTGAITRQTEAINALTIRVVEWRRASRPAPLEHDR